MHIVRAFEEATKSRDALVSKLTKLSMDAAAAGNMELLETYQELIKDANAIIAPFTE